MYLRTHPLSTPNRRNHKAPPGITASRRDFQARQSLSCSGRKGTGRPFRSAGLLFFLRYLALALSSVLFSLCSVLSEQRREKRCHAPCREKEISQIVCNIRDFFILTLYVYLFYNMSADAPVKCIAPGARRHECQPAFSPESPAPRQAYPIDNGQNRR